MIDIDALEKNRDALVRVCICPRCQSFVQCGEKGGYCIPSIEKSGCIKEEKGCIYMMCPITAKMKLSRTFYCMRGPAKAEG